jgi:hypothetical protein
LIYLAKLTFGASTHAPYYYFWKGDANDWLDRTVKVPKVTSLTLEQWTAEYDRLREIR